MADYSGLFGQYSNLQQPAQDPFAPLMAPPPPQVQPPPVMPRPKPANPYEARQQEAMDAANAASMAAAMKQQAHQDEIIAKTSANEAQRANREREVEETRAKVFADVDAKQQALINEATKGEQVDPRGRFGNAGTGAKLAMGIMGFLQGFIDPKGGPGKMAAWVDNIVQKDIATQMANIEQKNRVLGMKQSALDKGVARDSAMLDAQLAATARAYDGAQRIIEAEKAKNPAMAEMAQAAQAELQMKMQEKFEAVRQQNRALGLQGASIALQKRAQDMGWAQNEADRMERIGNNAMKAQGEAAKLAAKGAGPGAPEGLTPKEARELVVHGADGRVLGYARNAAAAEKVSDKVSSYEDFRKDLVDYRKMLKDHGREFSGVAGYGQTKAFREMETKHKRLLISAKEMAKLGVLSGPDLDLVTAEVPAPRGLLGGNDPLPSVDDTIRALDGSMDRFMKINVPGAERYSPPSFEDIGGVSAAGVAPGEGRTKNSIPLSLRPQDMGQQAPGVSAVSGLPSAASTPFNPLASPWGR